MKLFVTVLLLASLACHKRSFRNHKISESPYCLKLDSLLYFRYYSGSKFRDPEFDRILHEIEKVTGIYGVYGITCGGLKYCDTFFNNDIRRWSKCFGCDVDVMPVAKFYWPWCDTSAFINE